MENEFFKECSSEFVEIVSNIDLKLVLTDEEKAINDARFNAFLTRVASGQWEDAQ